MPTALSTIETRPKSATTHPSCGAPLPILARIPWISRRNGIGSAPSDTTTQQAVLTHFEYLMGEFGLSCEAAAPSATAQLTESPVEPTFDPIDSIPSFDLPPMHAPAGESKWADMLLRLDTVIEPYTRAIVLMLLLAVAAFTTLLLRPAENESSGMIEQPASASQSLPPATAAETPAASRVAAKPVKRTKRPKQQELASEEQQIANSDSSQPPIAKLSAEIQPLPAEVAVAASEYPSVELPAATPVLTTVNRDDASTPREARLQDRVTPLPSNQ